MADSYNELFGYGSHSPDVALKLHWLMQETTGTSATDRSGEEKDGTYENFGANPITESSLVPWLSQSILFEAGTGKKVNAGVSLVQGQSNVSVGCFLKFNSLISGNIFTEWNSGETLLLFADGDTSDLRFAVHTVGGAQVFARIGPSLASLGTVNSHCVIMQYNDSAPELYVDNVGGIGSPWLGSAAGGNLSSSASTFRIGAIGADNSFPGQIGESFVFHRNLSSDERLEIQNGPEPLNTSVPTLTITSDSWTGTIGTWNSQSNGTITYQWTLYDSGNAIIESGAGASPSGSGTYSGNYYLHVRASNDGGYDAGEDSASVTTAAGAGETSEGYGNINAVGSNIGEGETPSLGTGYGNINSVGTITGAGSITAPQGGYGNIGVVASITGVSYKAAESYNQLFGLGSHAGRATRIATARLQETGAATTAVDDAGNYPGTYAGFGGTLTTAAGPKPWLPSGIVFSTDKTVNFGDIAEIAGNELSVSCWFKLTSTAGVGSLLEQWDSPGAFQIASDGGVLYSSHFGPLGQSGRKSSTTLATLGTSDWHHITIAIDQTGLTTFYIDGVAESAAWFGSLSSPINNSPSSVAIKAIGTMAQMVIDRAAFTLDESNQIRLGPEPLNTVAPTLSVGTTSFTANMGTWDSQSNGTLSYTWQLLDLTGNVIDFGTTASVEFTRSIDFNALGGRNYYLVVRSGNDGGYDAAEDTLSNISPGPSDGIGSGNINAVGKLLMPHIGSGNINMVGALRVSGVPKTGRIKVENLVPLGGWRIPQEFHLGGLAIDFTNGKLYTQGSATIELFEVAEYTFDAETMGTGTDVMEWPVLTKVASHEPWWHNDLKGMGIELRDGVLWISQRRFYDTAPGPLTLYGKNLTTNEVTTIPLSVGQQSFGGGFVKGHADWLVGCGGLESGQGWVTGPTAARVSDSVILLNQSNGSVFEDREIRPPSYHTNTFDSGNAVDGFDHRQGVGRWAHDKIYGGGMWHPMGLMYWPILGTGLVQYFFQSEVFTNNEYDYYMYSYDPINFNEPAYEPWPYGMVIGSEVGPDGLLYLVCRYEWTSGIYQTDSVVRVFQVVADDSSIGNINAVASITGQGDVSARTGHGNVNAVATITGEGPDAPPPILSGYGNINSVATLTGAGATTRAGSGNINAVGLAIGTAANQDIEVVVSAIIFFYFRMR